MWAALLCLLLLTCGPSGPTGGGAGVSGPGGDDGAPGDSASPPDSGGVDPGPPPSCVDLRDEPDAPSITDCNGNGRADAGDIADARSLDCDADGVPDECQFLSEGCRTEHAEGWMEYRAGTLPVILSAPHGGSLRPDSLETRPDASTGSDLNTQELALAVSRALFERTGRWPHLVMLHLHRHKVEVNTFDLDSATSGQTEAVAAFDEYHGLIDAAAAAVTLRYGRGLYLDLHGLASSRTHLELGYLLSGSALVVDDARLDHPAYAVGSSVRAIERRHRERGHPLDFSALIRGPQSMGGLLAAQGYPVVPEPDRPWPLDTEGEPRGYFSGGYSTGAHGSWLGGNISGLQIEHTWGGVRDSAANRERYAEALAASIEAHLDAWEDLSVGGGSVVSFSSERETLWEAGEPHAVRVERSGDLSQALTVGLTVEGTATPGVDLELPLDVRFEAGESEATVLLLPIDDAEDEGAEALRLGMDRGPGHNVGRHATLDVHLADDERPSAWLGAVDAVVEEGGQVAITLRRDDCATAAQFALDVPEGALHGPDGDRILDPITVSLASGEDRVELWFRPDADGVAQGARSVDLRLEEGGRPDAAGVSLVIGDGDLDPSLSTWVLAAGDAPLADRAGADRAAARPLPDAAAGPAISGGGAAFDGDDDGLVLDAAVFRGAAGPVSVAFWFRADPAGEGYHYLLSHRRYTQAGALNVYLTPAGTLRTVATGWEESYDVDRLDVSGDHRDGEWHHYALSVDPASSEARVWLDGAQAASGERGAGGLGAAAQATMLGMGADARASTHLLGELAELRVYDGVLDAASVASLAATPPG